MTSGEVAIAYQVVGEGPFDVVLVPGFLSHVELGWRVPVAARTRERLVEFSRLILFDKRGTGMSDRVSGAPTQTRMGRPPPHVHGKEGVDGSSPSEGFLKGQQRAFFVALMNNRPSLRRP